MLSKRTMKYFTNPKELPAGTRNALTIAAVMVGVAVGIAAIFEKPIIKAATDFFSTWGSQVRVLYFPPMQPVTTRPS